MFYYEAYLNEYPIFSFCIKTSHYYNYYVYTDTHYYTHSPGFVNMVPIVVYSQVLHEGIPMIAQPARDKKNLHKLFAGALTFACES